MAFLVGTARDPTIFAQLFLQRIDASGLLAPLEAEKVAALLMMRAITTLTAAAVLLFLSSTSQASNSIVKSIWKYKNNGLFDKYEHRRMQEAVTPIMLNEHRRLGSQEEQEACDSAFLGCLPNTECLDCFSSLQTAQVDWASVTPGTACVDVVEFLNKGKHCLSLNGKPTSIDVFCQTFDACVVWEDENENDYSDHEDFVNCTALTECNWDGIHKSFLGDGVCHDNIHGCYNTEICGYDKGDCCEDTCDGDYIYVECGHDGYHCRDPKSKTCNPSLTTKCLNPAPTNEPDPSSVTCDEATETKYRLVMYDSFGDGWDTTVLNITSPDNKSKPKYTKKLGAGAIGTEYVCLSKAPSCYSVQTGGGTWGIEVSWEVKGLKESPAIAAGGAPMTCEFSVAGGTCANNCTGKAGVDITDDPEYKSYKELYECISEKCVIQLGACQADHICKDCFVDDAPDYCFNVDTFDAVIDCTMCSCTDRKDTPYCTERGGPGAVIPPTPTEDENSGPRACTPAETIKGSNAVIDFSKCTKFDQVKMMVTEFDNNNFGQLDTFEACAHSFKDDSFHGGHTALGCMRILYNAITSPTSTIDNPDAPKEAIKALATFLYNDAEGFCNCAKKASADCPLCPSFMQFKTLLYESLDACQALDEIDCDAWKEFYLPCRDNLVAEFQVADFAQPGQCDYTKNGCGDAGPFPAFRRLDCKTEVSADAWSFYEKYSANCLSGSDGIPPVPAPTPSAPIGPSPTAPVPTPAAPTPSSVVPSDDGNRPTQKPYIPSDSGTPYVPSDSSSEDKPKKSHWMRNLLLLGIVCGGGYFYYKRRSNAFSFVRYRRARNFDFDAGQNEMYSGLNNSTTFEPPSLPPTPTSMGPMGQMMNPMGHNMNPMGQNMNPMGQMGMQMT